jgi:hypothetical protein
VYRVHSKVFIIDVKCSTRVLYKGDDLLAIYVCYSRGVGLNIGLSVSCIMWNWYEILEKLVEIKSMEFMKQMMTLTAEF